MSDFMVGYFVFWDDSKKFYQLNTAQKAGYLSASYENMTGKYKEPSLSHTSGFNFYENQLPKHLQ
jgi:hypothetical protein